MGRFGRRYFLIATAAVLAAPLAARAQAPKKVRVGYLSSNPPSDTQAALDGFLVRLRELGYVEGQTLAMEYRYAQGRFDQLPELAAELVRLGVDVIFVYGTPGALAAKKATQTVPIVFGGVNDPLAVGLVTSLRQPGGNVTGVTTNNSELSAKRLSLLKEALPAVSRVAVLANPEFKPTAAMVAQTQLVSQSLAVRLHVLEARNPPEILAAFAHMASLKADAVVVMPDPWLLSQRTRIVELAMRGRIPAMYHLRQYLEVGGLMAYGPTYIESFQQGAVLVDKIVRGASPANLPVEQPWRYEVGVNLKTAKALGVTISPSVMLQADLVIE
jgi:putative tryptophan/tyrosine transport system substrate-binding protein